MSIMLRKEILKKYDGRCAYCGNQINETNMTIDHFDPKSKGGSLSIHNLVPSCKRCNEIKADGSIKDMKKKIEKSIKTLSRNKDFQMLKKYGLLKIEKEPIVFYYEIYEEK